MKLFQMGLLFFVYVYLTLPFVYTEDERSFSALKRVKNYLRFSLTQDHVCDFCIMAIEKSFTKSMSFEYITLVCINFAEFQTKIVFR